MFTVDVFSLARPPRSAAERAQAEPIRSWFRTGLGLNDDRVVTVNEVDCADPCCSAFETIIAVLAEGQPIRPYKIFLPLSEIFEAHDDRAIRRGPKPVNVPAQRYDGQKPPTQTTP